MDRQEEFYTSPLYQDIKDKFVPYLESNSGNSACYCVVRGNTIRNMTASVCFGSLGSMDSGSSHIVVGITQHGTVGSELLAKFLNLVINHTYFKRLFITTDIDTIMDDGFFVVDADHSHAQILSALILTRLYREMPQAVEKVVKLFEAGVQPMLAIFIGHLAQERNGFITLGGSFGSHQCVRQFWGFSTLKAYVTGMYQPFPTYKEKARYGSVIGQYVNGEVDAKGSSVMATLIKWMKPTKVKAAYVHPFPALSGILNTPEKDVPALPKAEFIKMIVERQAELLV